MLASVGQNRSFNAQGNFRVFDVDLLNRAFPVADRFAPRFPFFGIAPRSKPFFVGVNLKRSEDIGVLFFRRDEDAERLFVALDGAFFCCREALPSMIRARRGCIVNVSSVWGEVGGSCEAAYSAAKAGLIGLTKALAKEVGPSGVRVNCVAPGCIETAMLAEFSAEDRRAMAEDTPLGRIGTPEDVAQAVAFLASERASFITGQVLSVGGGFGK